MPLTPQYVNPIFFSHVYNAKKNRLSSILLTLYYTRIPILCFFLYHHCCAIFFVIFFFFFSMLGTPSAPPPALLAWLTGAG
jgi:hypothetical protein